MESKLPVREELRMEGLAEPISHYTELFDTATFCLFPVWRLSMKKRALRATSV
jgi:hypothetical protein